MKWIQIIELKLLHGNLTVYGRRRRHAHNTIRPQNFCGRIKSKRTKDKKSEVGPYRYVSRYGGIVSIYHHTISIYNTHPYNKPDEILNFNHQKCKNSNFRHSRKIFLFSSENDINLTRALLKFPILCFLWCFDSIFFWYFT